MKKETKYFKKSPYEILRELKIRRTAEYFRWTAGCLIWWWNVIVSNAGYYFSNKVILEGIIVDAKMSSFSSEAFINTDTRRFKIHTSNMESLPPLPIPGRASYNASLSFDLLFLEIKWFLALLWFRYQVWIRHNASPSRVINMKIFFHVWILITFKRQNIIEVP